MMELPQISRSGCLGSEDKPHSPGTHLLWSVTSLAQPLAMEYKEEGFDSRSSAGELLVSKRPHDILG